MSSTIRLGSFFAVLIFMALWELVRPRRILKIKKSLRWFINLTLTTVNVALVYFLMGAVALTTAYFVTQHQWGLLNQWDLPRYIAIPIALIFMDFGIYLQHIMFHALPVLWRLHMVHHTDLDFDVSTGIRFHPLEIIISLFYKCGLIVIIGADPYTVILFEVILNATSLFNHGNVDIPEWLESPLRWVLVTPDVHRVHHSTASRETNSNFGFSVTWWDRLCGTFRSQPKTPHTEMEIGLKPFREQQELGLLKLLALPFQSEKQKRVEAYSLRKSD